MPVLFILFVFYGYFFISILFICFFFFYLYNNIKKKNNNNSHSYTHISFTQGTYSYCKAIVICQGRGSGWATHKHTVTT